MSIKRSKPLFSLADQLFNAQTVAELSTSIAGVDTSFDADQFDKAALERFPGLELKERINWLVESLHQNLSLPYSAALKVLQQALPAPLDPSLSDDDFGSFIWVVPGEYAAKYGCTEEHLALSLPFLAQTTMRFSAESAIRPFLKKFPAETMRFVRQCATSNNYHVRRLASEGIRPYLPWATKVVIPTDEIIAVLDGLYRDNTRYVTRSVANTINDISRDDPDLVLQTIKRWQKSSHPDDNELKWVVTHALRTLIKQGNAGALEALGYPSKPDFRLTKITSPATVKVGEQFDWSARLHSKVTQNLKITFRVYYLRNDGSHSAKTFAFKDASLKAGETLDLHKKVSFKPISTRTMYAGDHFAEIVVNGITRGRQPFLLEI